jgi:hypothetical protein
MSFVSEVHVGREELEFRRTCTVKKKKQKRTKKKKNTWKNMARDGCLARVTAGVAVGGAVGGAVGIPSYTPSFLCFAAKFKP